MSELANLAGSTDAVRRADRFPAWQSVDGFDEEQGPGGDFWATMDCVRYGDITVARIIGARRFALRSEANPRSAADGVVIGIAGTGRFLVNQAHRDHLIGPGEACFFDTGLPGTFAADAGGEYWLVALPSHLNIPGCGAISSLAGCRIGAMLPELRLLSNYLRAISTIPGLHDPVTRSIIGRQTTDLILAAIRRANDASQAAGGRGIRGARYRLVLEEIGRRFAEPMLNGERIALTFGVSARYLQLLFEENGNTVSAQILDERLKAVQRMLCDPVEDSRSVADIAYACGFSDISHFNRAYRKKFGTAPKAARKER